MASTLGSGIVGSGGVTNTLGSGTAWWAIGRARRLLHCSLALVVAALAAAILVNKSLSFVIASAILTLHDSVPFIALVSI